MDKIFTYSTITKPTEGIYSDKGSKFIGYVFPIKSEDEFKSILKGLKSAHSGARHFCYAYRLGRSTVIDRSNDDGEPSGTAGKPILNQIISAGLTEIGIVVVRYFGGTLLGTPGLIQAYKGAAKMALENSIRIEKEITQTTKIAIPYTLYNEFMNLMKKYDIKPESSQSLENETLFEFNIPERILEKWQKELNDLIKK